MKLRIVPDQEAAQTHEGIMVVQRKINLPRHLWEGPGIVACTCSQCGAECRERVNNPPLLPRVCFECAAPSIRTSDDFRMTTTAAACAMTHLRKPQGNA